MDGYIILDMKTKLPNAKPKPKLRLLRLVRKQAWDLQSEWVRKTEKGICFTCGDQRDWKEQQAGHFIHRNCLDFDLRNIHCQCVKCNKYLSGNLIAYTQKMLEVYDEGTIADLQWLSKQVRKFSRSELEDLIFIYKQKIKELNN